MTDQAQNTEAQNTEAQASNPAAAFQALDAAALQQIIGGAQAEKSDREAAKNSGGGGGNYLPMAYLQEGKHKMRIFADPAGKLYRMVRNFKLQDPKKNVMDPRFFKQADGTYKTPDGTVIEQEMIDRIWDLTRDMPWQNVSRTSCLVYIYLISSTNASDDWWKPGTLYLCVANGKFEEAYLSQISQLSANEQVAGHIASMINPTVEGWGWDVTVVKGSQGSVSMTPTLMVNHPAVEIDDSYRPLSEVYVRDEYNPADIQRLVTQLEEARIELGLDEGEEDSNMPDPNADGSDAGGDGSGAEDSKSSDTPNPDASKSGEAGNTEGSADKAADMFGGNTAGAADAGKADDAQSNEQTPAADQYTEGHADSCGLTQQQLDAAKSAGMTPQQFKDMMGG